MTTSLSPSGADPSEARFDRRQDGEPPSAERLLALTRHLFPDGRVPKRIEALSGGYSNANYALDFDAERVVLRLFLGGAAVGEREVAALRLARAWGIAVPEVLAFAVVDGQAVAALRFVEGELLSRRLCAEPKGTDALLYAVGGELARIHGVTFAVAGVFAADGSVGDEFGDFCGGARKYLLERLDGVAGERLGPAFTAQLRRAVDEHWHCVAATYRGPALVHCDFNPKNLLVSSGPDPRVTTVLDWEFAMAAHPAIDFGNFLRFDTEDYPAGGRAAFVAGYRDAGGVLLPSWERAALLLDLTSMADFLSRTVDLPKTVNTARAVLARTLSQIASW